MKRLKKIEMAEEVFKTGGRKNTPVYRHAFREFKKLFNEALKIDARLCELRDAMREEPFTDGREATEETHRAAD